jgi:hypothetical protein
MLNMELLLEHFLHDLEQNPKLSKQSSPFSGQISMSLTGKTTPYGLHFFNVYQVHSHPILQALTWQFLEFNVQTQAPVLISAISAARLLLTH